MTEELNTIIRGVISDAYYDARSESRTMEEAADDAVIRVYDLLAAKGLTIAPEALVRAGEAASTGVRKEPS
jgi:hypothetical protein